MRILLTGASGHLGSYVFRHLQGEEVIAWMGTQDVDLSRLPDVAAAFRQCRADVILHVAALASVAACRADPKRAYVVNVSATQLLALLAAETKARLVFVSTDLVFDGEHGGYCEEDEPKPLSIYGQTKRAAEEIVLAHGGVVARLSLLVGLPLTQKPAFFDQQVHALRHGQPITCFTDEWRTPLSLAAAARALVELARSDFQGLLHLGGPERLTRWEMGVKVAAHLGADVTLVRPGARNSAGDQEPRPRDVSLDSSRWRRLFPDLPWPRFDDVLEHEPYA